MTRRWSDEWDEIPLVRFTSLAWRLSHLMKIDSSHWYVSTVFSEIIEPTIEVVNICNNILLPPMIQIKWWSDVPENTRCETNAALILANHLGRWSNLKQHWVDVLCAPGYTSRHIMFSEVTYSNLYIKSKSVYLLQIIVANVVHRVNNAFKLEVSVYHVNTQESSPSKFSNKNYQLIKILPDNQFVHVIIESY